MGNGSVASLWTQSPSLVEPAPVDEARLALRLVEMTRPSAAERAIIVFDPTYYPGITQRLREELHRRGVLTYAIVEDTEPMIESYIKNEVEHDRRERDVIETLLPVFQRFMTPEGTDVRTQIAADQWFHFGDGDASKERAAQGRSVRDREIELPVGMLCFVPVADSFAGHLYVEHLPRISDAIRAALFHFERGQVDKVEAAAGVNDIHSAFREIGLDGNKIGTVWLHGTNPLSTDRGVSLEIGSNWETGGTNRATGMRRIHVWLQNATLIVADRVIMRAGAWQWDAIP